jgi:hypothetical protein
MWITDRPPTSCRSRPLALSTDEARSPQSVCGRLPYNSDLAPGFPFQVQRMPSSRQMRESSWLLRLCLAVGGAPAADVAVAVAVRRPLSRVHRLSARQRSCTTGIPGQWRVVLLPPFATTRT